MWRRMWTLRLLFVALVRGDLAGMRVWGAVPGLLVILVLVSGCTSESSGTPIGRRATEPQTSEEAYGAPRVSDPLDVTGFLERPCAVLTPKQLAEFSVRKPGESDTESAIAKHSGPGCAWWREDTEEKSVIGMSFLTGNKHGLSDTYRGRDRFDFFEETTVDGYPAVFDDLTDGRARGDCNITVGISDTLTFRAREGGGPEGQIICDRTKQLASAILATLKAGA
jgi:Protein of unknown function (DUF3558)